MMKVEQITVPTYIFSNVDEYLSIYIKSLDFILYFNDILDLNEDELVNTFIPLSYKDLYYEYKDIILSKFLIKEYLNMPEINIGQISVIYKFFGGNHDPGNVYEALQNYDIYVNDNNYEHPYTVDSNEFISVYKDIFDLEPYIPKSSNIKNKINDKYQIYSLK
ncbi:hypothetical protein [Francisella orientalis]|uniref:hypothetical protein n=1 Tax=Francisella orientalis TaxID=299583 RepID=UPI0012BAA641|nr:hypothetical protein [Francisella orientalis]